MTDEAGDIPRLHSVGSVEGVGGGGNGRGVLLADGEGAE